MTDKKYYVVYDPEDIYESGTYVSGQQLAKDYLEVVDGEYPILENLETFEDIDRAVRFVCWAWGLQLEGFEEDN